MRKSQYVVTVTRQFGSLGRPIAKLLSEKLNIEYYDRDIVDQAAKELSLPISIVDEEEETAKRVSDHGFRKMIVSVDEARNSYHMQYAGFLPDDKNHKDVMLNSSLLGIEGSAACLADIVKRRFAG